VQLAKLQVLVRYCFKEYDWRKGEAKLNAFPTVQDEDRQRSVFEQIKLIGPLTDPTKYGGRAEDSASRLYWEYKGGFFNAKGVSIPVAVSVFPGEQYQAPRSWTERAYPKLIYYHQAERAATSRRGSSRRFSLRNSGQRSNRYAEVPSSLLRLGERT
jgi:hypothetical protein